MSWVFIVAIPDNEIGEIVKKNEDPERIIRELIASHGNEYDSDINVILIKEGS